MSSACPVNVVPSTAATPIVFSSMCGSHVLGADRVLLGRERHDPRLDVEVAAELLPHDVHVAAEHEVGTVDRLAGGLAAGTPLPLQRQRAEHDRLGGSLRARAGRLSRRVEEVGEHPDAALLDLGRLRILGVIDEVHAQGFSDQLVGLGLHLGGHERREIARRQAVEHRLLLDQPQGFLRGHARSAAACRPARARADSGCRTSPPDPRSGCA